MFEKGITPYQNVSILLLVSFAFQTLMMPIILSEVDGPVGWISIIIGAVILLFTIKPINRIMDDYKEDTIVGISSHLLPKFVSKSIGAYYIVLFIVANSLLMKDFAEQIKLLMLFKTPISFIIITILLTASYAAKKGIQPHLLVHHPRSCHCKVYLRSNRHPLPGENCGNERFTGSLWTSPPSLHQRIISCGTCARST